MSKIIVRIPAMRAFNYEINIGKNLLNKSWQWIPKQYFNVVIITDSIVCDYYASSLVSQLKSTGYNVFLSVFPAGEKSKNTKIKQKLEEKILSKNYGRKDTLILALGGGVVGDLAGFIAATYMRGIPYIQIPTTLLAMVDSSVGGKVAVNTPQGKNLIGAFWHPLGVIADINTLKTLDKKHIIAGLIEAMKMFLTNDSKSFNYLIEKLPEILLVDNELISVIINKAVKIKTYVVNKDEKEISMRMVLNFGHTIAHALEKLSNYKILHGYAVGYGILVEAKISQIMGILSAQDYKIIEAGLALLGIDKKVLKKYNVEKIIELTHSDKKNQLGKVRYVLLEKIGTVYLNNNNYAHPVSEKIVREVLLELQRLCLPV